MNPIWREEGPKGFTIWRSVSKEHECFPGPAGGSGRVCAKTQGGDQLRPREGQARAAMARESREGSPRGKMALSSDTRSHRGFEQEMDRQLVFRTDGWWVH